MLHKIVRYLLGLHGLFHIIETGLNLYEKAYLSALFTLVSSIIMLLGAYIDYEHHN
tara:strand:- start:134 stop:301 length:168 start_codon:yes stop_codon:yes gene_type:complete